MGNVVKGILAVAATRKLLKLALVGGVVMAIVRAKRGGGQSAGR